MFQVDPLHTISTVAATSLDLHNALGNLEQKCQAVLHQLQLGIEHHHQFMFSLSVLVYRHLSSL